MADGALLSDDDLFGGPDLLSDDDLFGAAEPARATAGPGLLTDDDLFGDGAPIGEDPSAGRISTGISNLGRGAADVAAGLPKAEAIMAAQGTQAILSEFDRIDAADARGERPGLLDLAPRDRVSSFAMGDIMRYREADPTARAALRAKYAPGADPRDRASYKAGQWISDAVKEALPVNPEFAEEWLATKIPQGLGSAAGFLALGMAGAAVGAPGALVPAVAGSALQASQQFEDAIGKGASIEDAFRAANLGAIVGTSEAIPIGRLLDRLDKGTGGSIKRLLVEAMKQGGEELVQEVGSTIAANLIASDLVGYDPERGTFQGSGEAAGVGFTVGALMQTIGGLVFPGGRRGGAAPGQPTAGQQTGQQQPGQPAAPEWAVLPEGVVPGEAVIGAVEAEPAAPPRMAPLTPDDIASPLPNDVISRGKAIIDDALAGRPVDVPAPVSEGAAQPAAAPATAAAPSPEWRPLYSDATRAEQIGWTNPATGEARMIAPAAETPQPEGQPVAEQAAVAPAAPVSADQASPAAADSQAAISAVPEGVFTAETEGDQEVGVPIRTGARGAASVAVENRDMLPAGDQRSTTITQPDQQVAGDQQQASAPADTRIDAERAAAVDQQAEQIAEPTEAQKEAGNYRKGHTRFAGLDITVETGKGQERTGTDPDGKPWKVAMPAHYGYLKRTEGADGDQVDVYLGDGPETSPVWVIDQVDADTKAFDEHKVMLGVPSRLAAEATYLRAFSDGRGRARLGAIRQMTADEFKTWLRDGDQTKPATANVGGNFQGAPQKAKPRPRRNPVPLIQFVRDRGGIDPNDPHVSDIRSMLDTAAFRLLAAPARANTGVGGRGIDYIREAAVEAGYLPEGATINDLLDAIRQDATAQSEGRPRVVTDYDVGDQLEMERRQREEREADRYINRFGNLDLAAEYEGTRAELLVAIERARDQLAAEDAEVDRLTREGLELDPSVSEDTADEDAIPFDFGTDGADAAAGASAVQAPAGAASRAQGEDRGSGSPGEVRRGDPAGGDGGDRAGPAARGVEPGGVATEQTDQGEQILVPGVAPVTDRARAEAKGAKPLRSDKPQKPADDGIFDVAGRGQGDLLSAPPAQPAAEPKAAGPTTDVPSRIEDFGEKLAGARKDTWRRLTDALSDQDIDVAAEPLSKSFPRPDYVKLAADGADRRALALVAIMRDTIPTKPRRGFKLARWKVQVDLLRGFAAELMSGAASAEDVQARMRQPANEATAGPLPLRSIADTLDVVADMPPAQIEEAAKFRITSSVYSVFNSKRLAAPTRFYSLYGPGGRQTGVFAESLAEIAGPASTYIAEKVGETKDAETGRRRTPLQIYKDRDDGKIFIGFKGHAGVIRLKAGFDTAQAAREYMAESADDLQAEIDRMRDGPNERRAENRTRKGPERREEDVTPEKFQEAFGFRGVQFGNYVEGGRRQKDLNEAFDALMDMAETLGIPSRALSLDGKLGLAFGARGHGGRRAAAAHYEPGQIAINLTKNAGPGSLAHEWLHALDDYFGRQDAGGGTGGGRFMTDRAKADAEARDARPEVFAAFQQVRDAITGASVTGRSLKADEARSKPYWATTIELAARSFEKYIIDRMAARNIENDYLANIDEASGVYPSTGEMESEGIRDAFDRLFNTVEAREGEGGRVGLYDIAETAARADAFTDAVYGPPTVAGEKARAAVEQLLARIAPDAQVRTPDRLLDAETGTDRAFGLYIDGIIHVALAGPSALRTARHEAIHYLRQAGIISDLDWRALTQAATEQGWIERFRIRERYARQRLTESQMIEEAIAEGYAEWAAGGRQAQNRLLMAMRALKRLFDQVRAAVRRALGRNPDFRDLFSDIETGRAGRAEARSSGSPFADMLRGMASRYLPAWHGSPHDFDRFRLDKIGTGEGAQAYGWGLYFASLKVVAEHYRRTLTGEGFFTQTAQDVADGIADAKLEGLIDPGYTALDWASEHSSPIEETKGEDGTTLLYMDGSTILIRPDNSVLVTAEKPQRRGKVYEVDLAPEPEHLLDWDKPLSEQSEYVRERVLEIMRVHKIPRKNNAGGETTGGQAYNFLAESPGFDQRLASEELLSIGIPGLRYRDAGSRFDSEGEGSHNYVIFDENAVEVTAKYDLAVPPEDRRDAKASVAGAGTEGGAAARQSLMMRLIESQPLDRIARLPFDVFGGIDERGEWKAGRWLSTQAARVITDAEFKPDGRMAWMNDVLQKARAGLVDRYGLDADYVDRDLQRALDERRIQAQIPELMATFRDAGIGAAEAKVLQAVLTGEAVADADMAKLSEPVRNAIDSMGQEAVRLGLLSAESYERNRGAYLHRVYLKHETDQNSLVRWAARLAGNQRKKISGEQFKGRGMWIEVAQANVLRHTEAAETARKRSGMLRLMEQRREDLIRRLERAMTQADERSAEMVAHLERRFDLADRTKALARAGGATVVKKPSPNQKGRAAEQGVSMNRLRNKTEQAERVMAKLESQLAEVDSRIVQLETKLFADSDLKAVDGDRVVVLDRVRDGKVTHRAYVPEGQPRPDRYADYADKGAWQVRGKKGGKVVLWRDFTKAERMQMGEIVDARYTIAKTYMGMAHDLATGRFYKDIAENREWSTKEAPAEGGWKEAAEYNRFWADPDIAWVRVPDTTISKSNTKRWCALAGRYVRAEIWRDIQETERMQTAGWWDTLMTQWKLSKTARSPVVHMNNVMSNVVLMDLADVRAVDLARGIRSMVRKDADYRDAVEAGAFGTDMMSIEIRDEVLKPLLEEIERDMQGGRDTIEAKFGVVGKVLDRIWSGAKRADRAMIDAYRFEDEAFRMATYMRRRSLGYSVEEAARDARDQFLNYDIRAPWVNFARRYFLPFLSYTYRAVPVIAKSVAVRPWKLAKYATVAWAVNELAYMITGDGDDEDEQRRSLREAEQGNTWFGAPRLIRMPWGDNYGNPVFLDVRRWIPAGDVFDLQGDLPAWLQFGGPLMLAAELMINRSAFTGQDIVNKHTDDFSDRLQKRADYTWKAWMPSAAWVPGSWYWSKIGDAATGVRDWQGRPYSVPQALASSVGIKVKPQDVAEGFYFHGREFDRVERELQAQARTLGRDRERGKIDEGEYHRQMDRLLEKHTALGDRRRETFEGR